jgi:hypothetical protein
MVLIRHGVISVRVRAEVEVPEEFVPAFTPVADHNHALARVVARPLAGLEAFSFTYDRFAMDGLYRRINRRKQGGWQNRD